LDKFHVVKLLETHMFYQLLYYFFRCFFLFFIYFIGTQNYGNLKVFFFERPLSYVARSLALVIYFGPCYTVKQFVLIKASC